MVILTEEMVVARTRISDLAAVKKLNCWGADLTDVSIIRVLKKVELLALSINDIRTLVDFQYCPNLQDLFIRRNNIKDLNEVCYLQNLQRLRNLWLDENPCAEQEGYRLAVLRALPNLEKLDNRIVTSEEVQNALSRGRILVHPLDMDASPTCSDIPSPEEVVAEYAEESEFDRRRGYDSSIDQSVKHQQNYSNRGQNNLQDYQENDRRNANWNYSPPFQYNQPPSNHYVYEEYDEQVLGTESEMYRDRRRHSSAGNGTLNASKQNDKRHYPESENIENEAGNQRSNIDRQVGNTPIVSPRNSYPPLDHSDERRENDLAHGEQNQKYEEKRHSSESDQHLSKRNSASVYRNDGMIDAEECPPPRDREMSSSQGGWLRHSEKEKCRFHYRRKPVTRNSNILSAVLCLVKELDYPSLEVVELAVRNRMDELDE